jgi:hypothetical protein
LFPNEERCVTNASLRLLVIAGALILVVAALTGATKARAAEERFPTLALIDDFRQETWSWQRLMQVRRTPTNYSERRRTDSRYLRWMLALWRDRADRAQRRAADPPHEYAWRCIQLHEAKNVGGWAAQTGNGYYGGLQLSLQFQRIYAPDLVRVKGTADRWTALEQMWVAERAHRDGWGFTPWPNTARACNLL